MDDHKEGATQKLSSDPFDPQPSESPPLTKLQRSILVENQKHNVKQIEKLNGLLHKLQSCEKILKQQLEAPGKSMTLIKTTPKHSSHNHGSQPIQTLEQVRSTQMALRKMKWQKQQMEAQQKQVQRDVGGSTAASNKREPGHDQKFKQIFSELEGVVQDTFVKETSVNDYLVEQMQNE